MNRASISGLWGRKLISRASVLILETSFQPLYQGQLLFDGIYELVREMGFVYMGGEDPIRNPSDGSILQCDSVFCRLGYQAGLAHGQPWRKWGPEL